MAQSTCSTAQLITESISINPDPPENPSTFSLCSDGSVSAFPAGLWYKYAPTKRTIALLTLSSADDIYTDLQIVIFTGSCDALICAGDYFSTEEFLEVNAGDEYYIFLYRDSRFKSMNVFEVKEIDSPANDMLANAFPITSQDLPFRGDFTINGAVSDFEDDACLLDGEHGIWFTYETTLSSESVILEATPRTYINTYETIGVQTRDDNNNLVCVASGQSSQKVEVEWIAEAKRVYYILIVNHFLELNANFELQMRSRGAVPSATQPVTPEVDNPAPANSPTPTNNAAPTAEASPEATNPINPAEPFPETSPPEVTSPISPPTDTTSAPEVSQPSSKATKCHNFAWWIGLYVTSLLVLSP